MRKISLAVVMIALLVGCSSHQKQTTDKTIFATFQAVKDTYALAYQSVMFTSELVNKIGTPVCQENASGKVCQTAKAYVKLYSEKIQPASVVADDVFRDAVAAFDAYLAGTGDEGTVLEKLAALQDAIGIIQKYLGDFKIAHAEGLQLMTEEQERCLDLANGNQIILTVGCYPPSSIEEAL